MNSIFIFSGPCGCGKSTLTDAYAHLLIASGQKAQAYVIHGDDFHRGFVQAEQPSSFVGTHFIHWPDILKFNWECILTVAQKALDRNLDVMIDYIVEDELPLLRELAARNGAQLYYIVLSVSEDELCQRLLHRGDAHLTERSLFLKAKLESMPENANHLYDVSGQTIQDELAGLNIEKYRLIT